MREIIVSAPSRIYEDYPGGRFSYSAMVDFFAKVGIGAIDMSFESLSRFDDLRNAILYAAAKRAEAKGLKIPLCHLSFYMPDPKNPELMAKYSRELMSQIDAAALMGISLAVVHPIAWYSSAVKYGDWVRANMAFLSPLAEYAGKKGVKLCVENMPSDREAPDNHLYGSCALNISSLAEKLGVGICWDVGHANISGYRQSEQMQIMKGKIDVLHIHDNDGKRDSHLIPREGSIDWEDALQGLGSIGFLGRAGYCLDLELKGSGLAADRGVRLDHAARAVSAARAIAARL